VGGIVHIPPNKIVVQQSYNPRCCHIRPGGGARCERINRHIVFVDAMYYGDVLPPTEMKCRRITRSFYFKLDEAAFDDAICHCKLVAQVAPWLGRSGQVTLLLVFSRGLRWVPRHRGKMLCSHIILYTFPCMDVMVATKRELGKYLQPSDL
jgi:hypothetical protein